VKLSIASVPAQEGLPVATLSIAVVLLMKACQNSSEIYLGGPILMSSDDDKLWMLILEFLEHSNQRLELRLVSAVEPRHRRGRETWRTGVVYIYPPLIRAAAASEAPTPWGQANITIGNNISGVSRIVRTVSAL
jgi:hypothetical protein